MNEFLEAAKGSDSDEDSEDRYKKAKKEEAGTKDENLAKQRYDELKEKAKRDYKKQEEMRDEEEEQEDEEDEEFVTY